MTDSKLRRETKKAQRFENSCVERNAAKFRKNVRAAHAVDIDTVQRTYSTLTLYFRVRDFLKGYYNLTPCRYKFFKFFSFV